MDKLNIKKWNRKLDDATPAEVIEFFLKLMPGKIALSTSLGLEDQVLTEIISAIDNNAKVFTLDTGRLFPEAYDVIDRTSQKYGITIEVFFPDREDVEEMVNTNGINLFYDSIEKRKQCCNVRKLVPLARAMEGLEAWITGLRRDQSVTRKDMQLVEWDENYNMLKINPLINWTEDDLINYIKAKNIPYNPLHDKGFKSIGCLPCTRAIEPGEDIRAGRWWWEDPDTKECGLHKQ